MTLRRNDFLYGWITSVGLKEQLSGDDFEARIQEELWEWKKVKKPSDHFFAHLLLPCESSMTLFRAKEYKVKGNNEADQDSAD